jgi:protein-S-isoprenylcysteine O-methyltransferase Ste14
MYPRFALDLLWSAFGISWLAAAWWSGQTERRPPGGSQTLYRVLTIVGAVMLLYPVNAPTRLWHLGSGATAWVLVAMAASGFLFSWWARICLGKLWSGTVTRKSGHHVIDTGPYAIVRHPIYSGLILVVWTTAALKATLLGFPGAVIMTAGFFTKARLEEKFLREELGADAYDAYRRRVPMLIPFGPRTG